MRYLFPGLIAGALAALFLFSPSPAVEIHPCWWGGIKNLAAIETSSDKGSKAVFPVRAGEQDYYLLKGNGAVAVSGSVTDGCAAFSGNGRYFAKYQKVGNNVEFFNAQGDRFWKIDSMEYPYLSYGGKCILLMNGDQSGIRMVDYNGNIAPLCISGKTCTALSFSDRSDYGAAGFFDGTYYIINAKGKIISSGAVPAGTMVKGLAVSANGLYAAVHYGGSRRDHVRIIEIESGDHDDVELAHVHQVKTSLQIRKDGYCTIIDVDRILQMSSSGSVRLNLAIPPKRPGHSSISCLNGTYAVSYTMQNGGSRLMLFRDDGVVFFTKEFPSEAFLDASLQDSLVFVRGSDTVFCYSMHAR